MLPLLTANLKSSIMRYSAKLNGFALFRPISDLILYHEALAGNGILTTARQAETKSCGNWHPLAMVSYIYMSTIRTFCLMGRCVHDVQLPRAFQERCPLSCCHPTPEYLRQSRTEPLETAKLTWGPRSNFVAQCLTFFLLAGKAFAVVSCPWS